MPERPYQILVTFKSGNQVAFDCADLELTKGAGKITELTSINARPRPRFIDLAQVESIWRLNPED